MSCPVCETSGKSSRLNTYAINLSESVVLCENPSCPYPFGYEQFTYIPRIAFKDHPISPEKPPSESIIPENKTEDVVREESVHGEDLRTDTNSEDNSACKPASPVSQVSQVSPPPTPNQPKQNVTHKRPVQCDLSRIKNPAYLSKIQHISNIKSITSATTLKRKPINQKIPSVVKHELQNDEKSNCALNFSKFSFNNDNKLTEPAVSEIETLQPHAPHNSSPSDVSSIHDDDLKILEEMCDKNNPNNLIDSSWMSMISDDFLNNLLIEYP